MDKDLLRELKKNTVQYETISYAAFMAAAHVESNVALLGMTDIERDLFIKLIMSELVKEKDMITETGFQRFRAEPNPRLGF